MNPEEKIISIISRNIEQKQAVTLDQELVADLGMDSLSVMMVVQALEDEFQISINDDDFKGLKTVRDVVGKLRATYPAIDGAQ